MAVSSSYIMFKWPFTNGKQVVAHQHGAQEAAVHARQHGVPATGLALLTLTTGAALHTVTTAPRAQVLAPQPGPQEQRHPLLTASASALKRQATAVPVQTQHGAPAPKLRRTASLHPPRAHRTTTLGVTHPRSTRPPPALVSVLPPLAGRLMRPHLVRTVLPRRVRSMRRRLVAGVVAGALMLRRRRVLRLRLRPGHIMEHPRPAVMGVRRRRRLVGLGMLMMIE